MKQLKFYKYAAVSLLVLNLVLVVFLLLSPSKGQQLPPPNGHPNHHSATEIMKLDEQQNAAFLENVKVHKTQIERLNKEQRQLLQGYFETLFDGSPSHQNDTLLQQVQAIEVQKIEVTYEHFKAIKVTLKPEQYEGFETFVHKMLKKITSKGRGRPMPRKVSEK